jgi:hypothetical protein
MTYLIKDPSARALAHLRMVQDELEQVARPDGCGVYNATQQQIDDMIANLRAAACAIREREEAS